MAVAAGAFAAPAFALDTAQWPPPDPVAQRMRELQAAIRAPSSTLVEREAAREELAGLLKSPAGQRRGRTPDERPPRPARAAIEPFPSVVKPLPPRAAAVPSPPPSPGIAHVEVIEPPKPAIDPRTGSVAAPAGRFATDPRTGNVLHEVPGGYVDPRTGQFIPR